jgi:hypothetical protein
MDELLVVWVLNDTVKESHYAADRITYLHFDGGRAQICLYSDDKLTRLLNFRQVEFLDRTTVGGG